MSTVLLFCFSNRTQFMFRQTFGWLFLEKNQCPHNAKCYDIHASSRNWCFGSKNLEKQQRFGLITIVELSKQFFSFFLLKTVLGHHLEVSRVKRNFALHGTHVWITCDLLVGSHHAHTDIHSIHVYLTFYRPVSAGSAVRLTCTIFQ